MVFEYIMSQLHLKMKIKGFFYHDYDCISKQCLKNIEYGKENYLYSLIVGIQFCNLTNINVQKIISFVGLN